MNRKNCSQFTQSKATEILIESNIPHIPKMSDEVGEIGRRFLKRRFLRTT